MPGTTKDTEPLLSLAFVSHMCSRTAFLKPPHWLFSSVVRAICLRRKDQLCHLNNPPPSAAPAPLLKPCVKWHLGGISLSVIACVFPITCAR